MDISSVFLVIGALMALAGAILIYESVKATPKELAEEKDEVRYIGPVPVVLKDGRKWIVTALIISGLLLFYLVAKDVYPDILGGLING